MGTHPPRPMLCRDAWGEGCRDIANCLYIFLRFLKKKKGKYRHLKKKKKQSLYLRVVVRH